MNNITILKLYEKQCGLKQFNVFYTIHSDTNQKNAPLTLQI